MADDEKKNGDHNPAGLTKNEKLVWEALSAGKDPLKAYEILDILKEKGVRAPMTVYRALDGLEEKGFIHKLEGMNSFVPCNHDGPHPIQAFLVCVKCASVEEVDLDGVESGLMPAIRRTGFGMHTARLEVKGACLKCAA
ncbi:MAG: Fur family transcriptional regulator [Pseudomonadota bacterium]